MPLDGFSKRFCNYYPGVKGKMKSDLIKRNKKLANETKNIASEK
jgi:hypothetical protein